ncbi:MAG: carbohydrate kinase [Leptolyngbyaceae cyanobacterium T60_A2020_046]|nr:carbohydrate kinase [Leptolyngbyaceae cyanobacterium T60_A2020_046]
MIRCVGEMLIDRVSAQPGRDLEAVTQWEDYAGGAPANVATALARLGAAAAFVGCISRDALGDRLLQVLRDRGVDCQGVQRCDAPTRIVYVVRDASGDRQFARFSLPDPGGFADAHLTAAALSESVLTPATCLVMGTLGLTYPATGEAMGYLIQQGKTQGATLVVDVNWRPVFWPQPETAIAVIEPLLAQADWIKTSADEAAELLGSGDPAVLARRFPQAVGIVVTDGDRGCQYWINGYVGTMPAFRVACRDATGAGDAFLAALIDGLIVRDRAEAAQPLTPDQIESSLAFASAAGALTTQTLGAIAAQPTRAEIHTFLHHRA